MLNWLRRRAKDDASEPPSLCPTRTIRVVCETPHYALIAPLDPQTTFGEILTEMEFIRDAGYRPIYPLLGMSRQGWICERLFPLVSDK